MVESKKSIHDEVDDYYSAKIREYGQSPKGVDWNGEESQFLRFQQLLKVVKEKENFSILDIGCGYGALIDYLHENYANYRYLGIDVSKEMIDSAKMRYVENNSAQFCHSDLSPIRQDYAVASGIFNVRLTRGDDEWWSYLVNTLDHLNDMSEKGFSFNCLTKYSDANKMRNYLYYADPCELFHWCKTKYSKQVSLLHDYGLYEFTILVTK